MVNVLVGRVAVLVTHGLVGAVAYDGLKKITGGLAHGTAVVVTSWGLRGARVVETGAEKARLAASDIVSEARTRIGNKAPASSDLVAVAHKH